jgi:hypothetical protein
LGVGASGKGGRYREGVKKGENIMYLCMKMEKWKMEE